MERLKRLLKEEQQRIYWFVSLVGVSYYAAGIEGAIVQAAFLGGIIALSVIKPLQRWKNYRGEKEEERPERVVYVRIQEPHALLVPLSVGGRMRAMTWQDVDYARYETHPEGALTRALEDYEGYKISHYVEEDPEWPFESGSAIPESGWIEVVPERDLPQEEE